ncbi:serine/threonine-protein kinase [Kitasatospora sp. MAP12-15]|uniref:serine/threonine-protein kinase n=1 Tax=unclassified Kitasatospora TaxID=2633591 RepID=UPI0024748AB9|nr:serine/threonine-protein kinase [Kitasatospora sp. MAP12-44]MDH6110767.1 serine/threonine-protein kinase [Kitasatospora sp. MAP12-44]
MRPVGSKYLLEETLGRGATGTVWRARVREDVVLPDLSPGQQVAIKVLKEELAADPDIVLRFLRERSVLLRLNHPNIVRVRDLVVEGELLALVMDLVEGPDLYRYLRSNGPLSPIAGSLLMAQVADALAVSHADGIVHRDLKPANVLLATVFVDGVHGGTSRPEAGGEQMHPMLTDFGIARLADSPGITRTSEFVGTPTYVAPESASGQPQTSAVDVYGAGIMLYELVTGRPPFQGDGPIQVLHAHLAQEPQRPPGMPEPLWTVVERCLRKDPAQRPSATSLAQALRVVAAGVGVHASPAAVDAAIAVGELLLPEEQPAEVPGTGPGYTLPGEPAVPPAGRFDPSAATQVMASGAAVSAEERTRLMPAGMPAPTGPGGPVQAPQAAQAPQPEGPHPWQTQLRAARDRNQQTQVFAAEEYGEPQVAPRPYQAGQGGYPPPGYPQDPGYRGQGYPQPPQPGYGYQQQPGPGPDPRYADPRYADPRQGGGDQGRPGYGRQERPPVAPAPYQAGRPAGPGGPGGPGRPGAPQGYREQQAPPSGQPYQQAPVPAGMSARRPEPPLPREREREREREAEPVREPEPRQRREPRQRSRNRMYIPGLGCLKGCLMVLLILAVAAVALWNFTPLPHYWANIQHWYSASSGWISSTWHSVTGN